MSGSMIRLLVVLQAPKTMVLSRFLEQGLQETESFSDVHRLMLR